jgi:hypothetical protein
MSTDPLQQLVNNRRNDLIADARRHALARAAHPRTPGGTRVRTAAAGWLFAAATRLEASARASRAAY